MGKEYSPLRHGGPEETHRLSSVPKTVIFVAAWDSSVCGTCCQFDIHVIWSSNEVCT